MIKFNLLIYLFFLKLQCIDYLINNDASLYKSDLSTANIKNVFLRNNISINNMVCLPDSSFDNLNLYWYNLPFIDNPSYFLVLDTNNVIWETPSLTQKNRIFRDGDTLNTNTLLTSSINSNGQILTIDGNPLLSCYIGNKKGDIIFQGSSIILPSDIYIDNIESDIKAKSVTFVKDVAMNFDAILNVNNINTAVNFSISPISSYENNIFFDNSFSVGCDTVKCYGQNIFWEDFVINSTNVNLNVGQTSSEQINYLVIDEYGIVYKINKDNCKLIDNYYVDSVIASTIKSIAFFYSDSSDKVINLNSANPINVVNWTFHNVLNFNNNNLTVNNFTFPDSSFNISSKMIFNTILADDFAPKGVILYFQNLPISISKLSYIPGFGNLTSCITKYCIFKNINLSSYSLGKVGWTNEFELSQAIMNYRSWESQIISDMNNLIQYIDYKVKNDINLQKIHMQNLHKRIFEILEIIKGLGYINDESVYNLLYEIFEEI